MPLSLSGGEYLMVREMVVLNLKIEINGFLPGLIINYEGRRAL